MTQPPANSPEEETRRAYLKVQRHEHKADPAIAPLHAAEADLDAQAQETKRKHIMLSFALERARAALDAALEPFIPAEFRRNKKG